MDWCESTVSGELCPPNWFFISPPPPQVCWQREVEWLRFLRITSKLQALSFRSCSTFESQPVKIECVTNPLVCFLVYSSPKPDKCFMAEFSDFVSRIVQLHGRLLILFW